MKNKEELKKVNEVRECTNEELAQVTGGVNRYQGYAKPYPESEERIFEQENN